MSSTAVPWVIGLPSASSISTLNVPESRSTSLNDENSISGRSRSTVSSPTG